MANEKKKGESKYALKRAARFAAGGRTFRSLGEGEFAAPSNPTPRPLDYSYFPKHTPKFQTMPGNEPMKHEDAKMVIRFRNKDHKYPSAHKPKLVKMIAYDHEAMNYAGWNAE